MSGENPSILIELGLKERPLVDRWARECLPIFGIRAQLVSDIVSGFVRGEGDRTVLQNGMEAPGFLLPIMRLWAEKGPIILCSYAHPEQFEFYKFMGQLNLVQFTDRMRARGVNIPMERVVENWYETVVIDRSVLEPLNLGKLFPREKLKADLLGVGNKRVGTETLDCTEQLDRIEDLDIRGIAEIIVNRFVIDLDEALKVQDSGLTRRERHNIRQGAIKDLIAGRIRELANLTDSVVMELRFKKDATLNEFLIEFEQRFAGIILGSDTELPTKIGELTGVEGVLSSKNEGYFNLVLDTLDLLVEAKGPDILKGLVNSIGDGLFLGVIGGKEVVLTLDKDNDTFILMNNKTWEVEKRLKDQEVLAFVRANKLAPLAKPETLALVASGMTFHMGSEHGNRARAFSVLGLEDERFAEFRKYLESLRIGQDLEQGNRLFLLDGTKPIPAVLAFVLLGPEFLKQEMLKRAGVENKPQNLNEREMRQLTARRLVEDGLEFSRQVIGFNLWPGPRHAGYIWE